MTDCGYWGDYSLDDPNCFECKGTRKFSCLLRTIHELEQQEQYWADKWYECITQLEGGENKGLEVKK